MFTGIIESLGTVTRVETKGTNRTFWIQSPLSRQLKVDQSLAHDGVCLTIEKIEEDIHQVTAIEETLLKTNLIQWESGTLVNLERSLLANARIDGHFVQGHVDTTGTCLSVNANNGSWIIRIQFPEQFAALVIEKGSISLNGTSLTVFEVTRDSFSVAIIPYTWEHTSIRSLQPGNKVNLEFDMIGKYILRKIQLPG
jgi:riboflavin synthase